jgi:hypothetical protein
MNKDARRKILFAILQHIKDGTYDSSYVPLDQLMHMHKSVRQEYESPNERDNYNYGYIDIAQMNANETAF